VRLCPGEFFFFCHGFYYKDYFYILFIHSYIQISKHLNIIYSPSKKRSSKIENCRNETNRPKVALSREIPKHYILCEAFLSNMKIVNENTDMLVFPLSTLYQENIAVI